MQLGRHGLGLVPRPPSRLELVPSQKGESDYFRYCRRVQARFSFFNPMNLEDRFVPLILPPQGAWRWAPLPPRRPVALAGGQFAHDAFGYAGPLERLCGPASLYDLAAD